MISMQNKVKLINYIQVQWTMIERVGIVMGNAYWISLLQRIPLQILLQWKEKMDDKIKRPKINSDHYLVVAYKKAFI